MQLEVVKGFADELDVRRRHIPTAVLNFIGDADGCAVESTSRLPLDANGHILFSLNSMPPFSLTVSGSIRSPQGQPTSRLTQTGDVVGYGLDFAVIELGGDLRHLQAVGAGTVPEAR